MGKIYMLVLFILLCSPSRGQSPYFYPFGKSFDEVNTYLQGLNYLDEIYPAAQQEMIVVFHNETTFEYRFQNDRLYIITLRRYYEDMKVARRAIRGGVEYFKLLEGKFLQPNFNQTFEHYVSVEPDRLLELTLTNLQGYIEVNLISTSRYFGPRAETEDLVYKLSAANR